MSTLWPFTIASLMSILTLAQSTEWRYPDLNKHEDFPKWDGMCDMGKHQSPINLDSRNAKTTYFNTLNFNNYDRKQNHVYIVNTGHTVQLYGFPTPMELSGGPLISKYQVEQIHFHWDSEHTINNERYPLEVHIVHRNKQYRNLKEAVPEENGVVVIGLLFHSSNEGENKEIATILEAIDEIEKSDKIDQAEKLNSPIRVSGLFYGFEEYYTYNGSLTTPGCDETVTWIVSAKTFPISIVQVNKFKEIEGKTGEKLENNYRFLQNLNGRTVVKSYARQPNNALAIAPSIILLVLLSTFTVFLK